MRHKRLRLFALFLLCLGLTCLQAQNIYVRLNAGTQTSYAFDGIKKMSFASGNIIVQPTGGSTATFQIDDVRYLNFVDLVPPTAINETDYTLPDIRIYPNPVTDELKILIPGDDAGEYRMDILTLDGKILKSYKTTDIRDNPIAIGELKKGIYLCRFSAGNKVTTIKFVKQ